MHGGSGQFLRRRHDVNGFLFDTRHNPGSGFIAMIVAMALSIWLFSNQVFYVGLVPAVNGSFGDIAFEAGFVIAAVLYLLLYRISPQPSDEHLTVPSS